MSHQQIYDFVILGNYTKDTIISAAGTRYVDGGGFNYGAHVTAMMKMKTAAVTRLASEDHHVVDNLTNLGVDVYATFTPQSTLMELKYLSSNVDQRVLTVNGTAGSFTPNQVADLEAKVFLLNASARGEIPVDVIETLREKETLIVADAQGFVRYISENGQLAFDSWEDKKTILPLFDVLKTDIVEAEYMTGETDIHKQAVRLAEYGLKEIVLTHRDGILVWAGGKIYEATFKPEELVGRSGRGDTCISSYMSARMTSEPAEAIVWSAAVTSLKMEAEGPILRELSEVTDMINKKYSK